MANLWITEYSDIGESWGGDKILVGREPALITQTISYTTSTQSVNLHEKTRFVRVKADADAHLVFGSNPTATVESTPIEANVAEYFGVEKLPNVKLNIKIAAYDGSS